MSYQETIDFLFTRLPMFSRSGAAALKADLVNTKAICEFLGNPERRIKTIHIAGTNGKGSVSHMLAAVLQLCGYKTGLYTSPHLKDFRERIRINSEMIPKEKVVDYTDLLRPVIDEINPSFFELTVGMTFRYFADERVDVAVIETGLGGRLDSTNVIIPALSVITNISWDHMNILDDSLQEIAAEKAGIIKSQVPVVIGETGQDSEAVFISTAESVGAEIFFADKEYYSENWEHKGHSIVTQIVSHHSGDHSDFTLDLPGAYQIRNLITVLTAIDQLRRSGFHLPSANVRKALSQVKKMTGLHGRWEQLRSSPAVVIDVAHNAAGIAQLVQQVELTDHHELHLVFGMVKDKDLNAAIALLPKTARYYFTQATTPRALPAAELQLLAAGESLKGDSFPNVNDALKAALASASRNDLVLIFGSVYLIGDLNF